MYFIRNLFKKKELIIDNIIYLTGQPGDVLSSNLSLTERVINIFSRAAGGRALTHPSFMEEVILMSTYEEFMVILTAGILLVSILEFAIHKK